MLFTDGKIDSIIKYFYDLTEIFIGEHFWTLSESIAVVNGYTSGNIKVNKMTFLLIYIWHWKNFLPKNP
jgi:hypothetical protein